jgi:hypothetical protein
MACSAAAEKDEKGLWKKCLHAINGKPMIINDPILTLEHQCPYCKAGKPVVDPGIQTVFYLDDWRLGCML